MQLDERVIRAKVEKTLGWATLILTAVGIAEKVNHYVKLAEKKKQQKKHPLGFRP